VNDVIRSQSLAVTAWTGQLVNLARLLSRHHRLGEEIANVGGRIGSLGAVPQRGPGRAPGQEVWGKAPRS